MTVRSSLGTMPIPGAAAEAQRPLTQVMRGIVPDASKASAGPQISSHGMPMRVFHPLAEFIINQHEWCWHRPLDWYIGMQRDPEMSDS